MSDWNSMTPPLIQNTVKWFINSFFRSEKFCQIADCGTAATRDWRQGIEAIPQQRREWWMSVWWCFAANVLAWLLACQTDLVCLLTRMRWMTAKGEINGSIAIACRCLGPGCDIYVSFPKARIGIKGYPARPPITKDLGTKIHGPWHNLQFDRIFQI